MVQSAASPHVGRRGIMLVLSSPSGAGKTSIARQLIALEPNLTPSISVTTRPMRPEETEGVDYYFIHEAKFQQLVADDNLLESATVFGNFYGTPRLPVEEALHAGRDLLFDIDWQGARQLTENARDDLVTVFVLPPEAAELERRLFSRAQDAEEVIRQRMHKAPEEMSHYPEYDYVIINYDLAQSVEAVRNILHAERQRRTRLMGLAQFVRNLQTQIIAKFPGAETS